MCEVGKGVETFGCLGLSAMKGVKGNPKWRGVKSGVRNKDHLYREVVSEWREWIDGMVA